MPIPGESETWVGGISQEVVGLREWFTSQDLQDSRWKVMKEIHEIVIYIYTKGALIEKVVTIVKIHFSQLDPYKCLHGNMLLLMRNCLYKVFLLPLTGL